MKKKVYKYFTALEYIGNFDEISVSKKTVSEDWELHWHNFFEIEIVVGGNGTQLLNGREYPLKRGCIYLLSPTDFHEVKTKTGLELYNIMFHESLLSEHFLHTVLSAHENNIFYIEEPELAEIIAMCKLLEDEYSKNQKYKNEFLRNILECFLILFLRKMNFSSETKSENKSNHIQKARLYINLHFKENPSLSEVAEIANLNVNYFSQKFKESTGKGYSAYLTELKISYAKKLLKSSDLSVTEICFACGFSSLSNFMKVFKERTGFSPAIYAKQEISRIKNTQ